LQKSKQSVRLTHKQKRLQLLFDDQSINQSDLMKEKPFHRIVKKPLIHALPNTSKRWSLQIETDNRTLSHCTTLSVYSL